jgi:hypothetical protein
MARGFFGIKESELSDYNLVHNEGEMIGPDWIQAMKDQKIYGFVDKDNVIHYWAEEDVTMDMLVCFIAHETGHLNGRKYQDLEKEEEKAHSYDQVAQYAYQEALKMKGKLS